MLLLQAVYERVEPLIYDASDPDPNEFMPLAHEAFDEDWNAPGMKAYEDYDRHRPQTS